MIFHSCIKKGSTKYQVTTCVVNEFKEPNDFKSKHGRCDRWIIQALYWEWKPRVNSLENAPHWVSHWLSRMEVGLTVDHSLWAGPTKARQTLILVLAQNSHAMFRWELFLSTLNVLCPEVVQILMFYFAAKQPIKNYIKRKNGRKMLAMET